MVDKRFNLGSVVAAGMLSLWLAVPLHPAVAAPSAAPVDVVLLLEDSGSVRSASAAPGLPAFIERLLDGLAPDARAALIVFDDVATPLVPLTPLGTDGRQRISRALASLGSTATHTNSAAGLERAIYELTADATDGSRRAIVLQHMAPIAVGDAAKDAGFRRWAIEVLGEKAAQAGIEIHSLSLGPRADTEMGALLAERTGGLAQIAASAGELDASLAALHQRLTPIDGTVPAVARSSPTLAPAPRPVDAVPVPSPVAATPPAMPIVDHLVEPVPQREPPAVVTADDIRAVEDLPAPAAGPATAMAAADKALTATADRLRTWPADHALWRVLAFALVALLLAAVTVTYLRRRRYAADSVEAGSGDGPRLVDVNGVSARRVYPLGDRIARISRSPGADTANVVTVHIPQDVISRAHAFVDRRDGAHWVTDPGSNNGTFVNDERVDGSRVLRHGDRLRFASFEFVFEDPPAAGKSARAGTASGRSPADDGDATVLLGQAETAFVPVASGAERTVVEPERADAGQSGQSGADPDPTIVRPAR